MQILLIEDNDDIREVAQISLEAVGGWQVVTAASGADGLVKAGETRPDAILLDVMMPDMDGPSTLSRLRGQPATADIPVVFLTAKAQPTEIQDLKNLGAVGLISKPFDPMTLPGEVSRLLGWDR